jgi:plastocyanin
MSKIFTSSVFALAALALAALALPASAADEPSFTLTIKDHLFSPDMVEVPANTKVTLVINNMDSTPEEFDSHALKREKVIPGGGSGVVHIGPLKPGEYKFVGEYHESTAKGRVVAK